MKTLLILALLLSPAVVFANHVSLVNHDEATGGKGGGCCRDGSSPWASQSKNAWQPNANAGFQGSELPPSSGYRPDQLNRYDNPLYSPYPQTPQPSPSPTPAYGTSDLRFDPSYGLCGGSRGPCGTRCVAGRVRCFPILIQPDGPKFDWPGTTP
jgi:hypothetical protein